MKRILITMAAGLVACSVFGQGAVSINTRGGGVDARVTDSLTGQFAAGTDYLAQLYYSAPGAGEAAMVPALNAAAPGGTTAAPAWFTTGTLPGYILTSTGGGNRFTDPAVVAAGANTDFQLRAWQANLGATWEAALAAWSSTTVLGKSAIITVATSSGPTVPPASLTGLAAFTLEPIPEPSVIALGAIGLVALLWRRRK